MLRTRRSTIRAHITQETGQRFAIADPDEFKELLIEDAARRGWLDELIPDEAREAGFTLAPMELSALVHEESSHLARRVRTAAINQGANVVIDSVMARELPALQQARALESHGYAIEVVSVQVPQELSQARSLQRWAQQSTEPLGADGFPRSFEKMFSLATIKQPVGLTGTRAPWPNKTSAQPAKPSSGRWYESVRL